jgi:hypothetical protein
VKPATGYLFLLDFISVGTSSYEAWELSKSRDLIQEMKEHLDQQIPVAQKAQIARQYLGQLREKIDSDLFKVGLSKEGKTKVKEKIETIFRRLDSTNHEDVSRSLDQSRVVLGALKERAEEKLSYNCHALMVKTMSVAFAAFVFFLSPSILLVACTTVSSIVGSTFWFWEKVTLSERDERIESIT